MEQRITPHMKALGDKHILGAAVRGITGELAERPLRLPHLVENLAFDDDFSTFRDIELRRTASRDAVGLAKERADDLVFPHGRRIVKGHRAHVVDRMHAEGYAGGPPLAPGLRA